MSAPITKTTNGLENGPRYFRSFVTYEIPFRPDEPVERFAETEGLKAFYRAYYDAEDRVHQFDKLLMVRAEKEVCAIELSEKETPGSAVYFEVDRDPGTGESSVGKRLKYPETEPIAEFFAGEADSSGRVCQAVLFKREIAFSDTYEYWPTGRLRVRTTTKTEHSPQVAHYNEKGRRVAAPAAERAGLVPPRSGKS
jgi:hypothetical protein